MEKDHTFDARHSMKISQAMIEIACMREWPWAKLLLMFLSHCFRTSSASFSPFLGSLGVEKKTLFSRFFTAQAMIEFRRSLIQAQQFELEVGIINVCFDVTM